MLTLELEIEPRSGRPEELGASASVVNTGSGPVTVNLMPLSSPSLALEIVDDEGQPVLLPPPPVPGGEEPRALLAPGDRHEVRYSGFVPQWTPPGAYRARLRYVYRPAVEGDDWRGELTSGWSDFVIEA